MKDNEIKFRQLPVAEDRAESVVALATIAAGLSRDGRPRGDAIREAYLLLVETSLYLNTFETAAHHQRIEAAFHIGLKDAANRLNSGGAARGPRLVQKYLNLAVNDPIEVRRIWKEALANGKPFSPRLITQMVAIQASGWKRRGRRAADSRAAKKR